MNHDAEITFPLDPQTAQKLRLEVERLNLEVRKSFETLALASKGVVPAFQSFVTVAEQLAAQYPELVEPDPLED